jgi:pimeloyl-ACP methyl ester carboxylesterase
MEGINEILIFGHSPSLAGRSSVSGADFKLRGIQPHHTTNANGIRMHYVTGGRGAPIVLLHGFASTWYEWRHVMPELAKLYTVVVPDLRGAGDSAKPATGYDKRTMAEDIYQLVRQLGHQRIFLVGHDIGFSVAYSYEASHPEDVRRLALIERLLAGVGDWEEAKRNPSSSIIELFRKTSGRTESMRDAN